MKIKDALKSCTFSNFKKFQFLSLEKELLGASDHKITSVPIHVDQLLLDLLIHPSLYQLITSALSIFLFDHSPPLIVSLG